MPAEEEETNQPTNQPKKTVKTTMLAQHTVVQLHESNALVFLRLFLDYVFH